MRICFFVCLHKYKKIANGLSIRVGVWWSRDISSAGYSLLDNTHPMQHRVGVIQKKNFILKKHWFCFVVVTRTKYYFVLHYFFNFILLCSASLVSNWIPLEHACNFSRVFFFKRSTILVYIYNEMRRERIPSLNFPPNKPNDLPQQCPINQDKKRISVYKCNYLLTAANCLRG